MDPITSLTQRLGNAGEEEATSIVAALVESGDCRAVQALIDLLEATDSPKIRNAAALGLRDIGDDAAIPALLRQIRHPRNARNRGTLIFALEPFDLGDGVFDLVENLDEGGYETLEMILHILREHNGPVASDRKSDSLRFLRARLQHGGLLEWQEASLREAIVLIGNWPTHG